jgi:hypothetical protein
MLRTAVYAGCLLALLVTAAPAQAQSTRDKIFRECQDGALRGDYSSREIRDARNNIPDDIDQYSDCRDVLSRALTAGAGGGGDGSSGGAGGAAAGGGGAGGGGGGGPALTPSTDADRAALEEAARGGGEALDVGGRSIAPGVAGFGADAARNTLPTTLIVVLALLALAAIASAAPVARRRAFPAVAGLGSLIRRRVLPGGTR